jgi:HAD superfamily phosphatase (TIGR01668 family)
MRKSRFGANLIPDRVFEAIQDIRPDWLRARGVKGLAVDLDNTLAFYGQAEPEPPVVRWVRSLVDAGIPVVVVTNNSEARVRQFCAPLGVPYVFRAGKPRLRGLKRAVQMLGFPPGQIAQVGDQVYTDVWGAKRSGMTALLVSPLQKGHFLFNLRRWLEGPFIRQARREEESA